MSENTTPAVQELAAAIRDALNPPPAADWDAHDRLVAQRAAYIVGALQSLAEDPDIDDMDRDVRITALSVRDVAEFHPVAYETKDGAE